MRKIIPIRDGHPWPISSGKTVLARAATLSRILGSEFYICFDPSDRNKFAAIHHDPSTPIHEIDDA